MKKSFLMIMILLSVGYTQLQAQEYRTDISVRQQIVNNKQRNVAYASKPASQVKISTTARSSKVLPSDISSEQAKKELEAKKQAPGKTTLPSQGEEQTKEKIKALVTKKQTLIKIIIPSQEEGQTKEKTKTLENKN